MSRKGNRVVSLPCIDTPLGGREVRRTVDIRNPFTFMSSPFSNGSQSTR
jgi:hypothetical protein